MGRPRDVGSESWATVREAADALGVTTQAIRNRIKAGTIPFDRQVDAETGQTSYRIDREWLDREAERKTEDPATGTEVAARTAEMLHFFKEELGKLASLIESGHANVTGAIEEQVSQVVPRLDTLAGAFTSQMEARGQERAAQAEEFKRLLLEITQGQEEQRAERQRLYELLSRVEQAERERAERGRTERRSFWRRMFGD